MLMNVKETVLPNGLRVVSSALPSAESVALGIWVGAGGRHEGPGASGASHFIEHLLFKGTARLSARDISQAIEGRGGWCNAFTQEEMTAYVAGIACEHAWDAFGILAEMYLRPRLAETDIEKERRVIIEEIMMYRDRPDQVVQEMLGGLLWRGHPLGLPLTGTPESLRRLTRDRLLAYKRRTYVPRNTVLAFAGRVVHDACVERAAAALRGLEDLPEPACRPVVPAVAQGRVAWQGKEIEQAQLALGFRIFGRFDARRYALKVLNVILGENMSSRLFQAVRERQGLAYSIHSSVQLFAETGVLAVSAGLDRSRRERALALILRELGRLKREPVGARELARAKEYVVGNLRLGLEGSFGHLSWMGDHLLRYRACPLPEDVIRAVQGVGAGEVRAVAGEVFGGRRASLALLAPGLRAPDGARLKEMLKELG